LSLSKENLLNPSNAETIKCIIREGLVGADKILLLDSNYVAIEKENVATAKLKLGIVLEEDTDTTVWQAQKFYVKHTDRRGIALKGHPFVTVTNLSQLIAEALSIPILYQQLYFGGNLIKNPTQTLLQLGINNNKVVHVVDTRRVSCDPIEFSVEVQTSKYPSNSELIEISGGTTLKHFKSKAATAVGIPSEFVVITYCSKIL
jgi:hypothetical protein